MVKELVLKKVFKKTLILGIVRLYKLSYIKTFVFYNFFCNLFKIYLKLLKKKKEIIAQISYILNINLVQRQGKINLLDLGLKKNYIYTIGLILSTLGLYKKSSRRILSMLKYVILFLLNTYFSEKNIKRRVKSIFIVKGLRRGLLKFLKLFRMLIRRFGLKITYLQPLKNFFKIKLKRKRFIKRRVYKKLIKFSI